MTSSTSQFLAERIVVWKKRLFLAVHIVEYAKIIVIQNFLNYLLLDRERMTCTKQ